MNWFCLDCLNKRLLAEGCRQLSEKELGRAIAGNFNVCAICGETKHLIAFSKVSVYISSDISIHYEISTEDIVWFFKREDNLDLLECYVEFLRYIRDRDLALECAVEALQKTKKFCEYLSVTSRIEIPEWQMKTQFVYELNTQTKLRLMQGDLPLKKAEN